MAFQFTCPHCSAVTRIDLRLIGQKGNCRSCRREITIEPDSAWSARQPHEQGADFAVKATRRGAAVGCCVTAVATFAFLFVPIILPMCVLLLQAVHPQGLNAAGQKVLFYLALNAALPCLVGAVFGAGLIGTCTLLLRKSPALFEYAWRGAAFCGVIPPTVVFATLTWPLIIQGKLTAGPALEQVYYHWCVALILAAVGAIAGVLMGSLVGLLWQKRSASGSTSPNS